MAHQLPYSSSVRVTAPAYTTVLPAVHLLCLPGIHPPVWLSTYVPTVLIICSAGISTCCPSATTFVLALGPDLPRADQLYPGILGYSAERIPTSLSLLIPAFSLPYTPRLLIGTASPHGSLSVPLRRVCNAPLPMYNYIPELRCRVSAPDIFGAGPLDQ